MNPNLTIAHIMSRIPYTIEPNTKIFEIKTIFEKFEFHHLPVVEDNKLEGIITACWDGEFTTPVIKNELQ